MFLSYHIPDHTAIEAQRFAVPNDSQGPQTIELKTGPAYHAFQNLSDMFKTYLEGHLQNLFTIVTSELQRNRMLQISPSAIPLAAPDLQRSFQKTSESQSPLLMLEHNFWEKPVESVLQKSRLSDSNVGQFANQLVRNSSTWHLKFTKPN
jgi:hypothetical protein